MPNPEMSDRLNEVGVLTRRQVEARILAPLIQALGDEFGRERVLEVVRKVVIEIARQQGAQLAENMGGSSLTHLAESLHNWKKDDAMQLDVLQLDEQHFAFNVTRCRYAEMYQALGVPELGELLSCNRDHALIEGFNPDVQLTRTQTIMQGSAFCDFRYEKRSQL